MVTKPKPNNKKKWINSPYNFCTCLYYCYCSFTAEISKVNGKVNLDLLMSLGCYLRFSEKEL